MKNENSEIVLRLFAELRFAIFERNKQQLQCMLTDYMIINWEGIEHLQQKYLAYICKAQTILFN